MNKIVAFVKVEKGKGFTSPKTGEPWWFWNLTDTEGDKYSIPSYAITFTPEEDKEYGIEFTVEKNGKWTNRKIKKMTTRQLEEKPITDIEEKLDYLVEMLEPMFKAWKEKQ